MCLQLENTTWNMVKEKLDTYFIYIDCAWNLQNLIQFLMCIHDVTYLHKWETDKATWMYNMKKGDYLKSAHKPKLLKSQFGINHPTLFFSVWNFKLGFLYLNFPKNWR